jgi:hypothetical protein
MRTPDRSLSEGMPAYDAVSSGATTSGNPMPIKIRDQVKYAKSNCGLRLVSPYSEAAMISAPVMMRYLGCTDD